MLPYYLRDTRHVNKKGPKRKRPDQIQDTDGGPVQGAITNDLIDLRERFRGRLLDRTKQQQPEQRLGSSNLWKPGTAFSIFKDVFGSSKTAMLHLLPPAWSSREAYSQLIYGACLGLFKESFGKIEQRKIDEIAIEEFQGNNDGVDHYNDAGFAIFLLLALFETNPLPREVGTENPLELLSINLRSSEDTRSSSRRYFSKNIRIDREHFSLLLRMKELALARKSDCEGLFFELQRLELRDYKSGQERNNSEANTEQGFSGGCSYGISIDVIEVLDRIFPQLELCEYTGPVGAEAFAGHPEYPHNTLLACEEESDCQEKAMHSTMSVENEPYQTEASDRESDEVVSLFQKYKRSVAAIRIPPSKSDGVRRLQTALEPLISRIDSAGFDEYREAIDFQHMHTTNRSIQTERDRNVNCRVLLERGINSNLKRALHTSVVTLLTRDDLLSPLSDIFSGIARSSLDADDVSSIGHGGISIATRHGAPAALGLRSPHRKNLLSKNTRFTKQRKAVTKQGLATAFLTSKQSASSDEDSVDSEITASSFSDTDSIEEDEVSVATSAFGKKALDDLLLNVARADINIDGKDTKKKSNRKKRKPRLKSAQKQNNSANENEEDEIMSAATSAFGKRALEDLLKQVDRKEDGSKNPRINKQVSEPKSLKNKKRGKTGTKDYSFEYKSENEEISVATTAFGKRALEDLLKHADRKEYAVKRTPKPRPSKNQRGGKTFTRTRNKKSTFENMAENEEISVATSAFGERALEDLLQHAVQEENDVDGKEMKKHRIGNQASKANQKASRKQKKGKAGTKKPSLAQKDGDEEISVATSAFGKRALEDLLQKAQQGGNEVDDNNAERRKRRKQKSNQGDAQRQKNVGTSAEASLLKSNNVGTDHNASGDNALGELLGTAAQDDDDEEISVATSAFGKRALEDLLQNATEI